MTTQEAIERIERGGWLLNDPEHEALDLAIAALRREAAVGDLVDAARSLLEKQQFFCKNAMYTDAMPGNEFYSDMFMEVIIATRKALSKFDGQREVGKDD